MKWIKSLIGLNLSVFMMMLGVGMIMALLPQRIIDLTGSGANVGYLASAFGLSYILLQVPIGKLADRLGFKHFLLLGYATCFLVGLIYFFSTHSALYFLGRVFQGAGEAPIWALAPALLSIMYPDSKGKAIGFYNASIHIGLTVGPVLGILLAKYLVGNRPFLFYAGACLTGALILWSSVDAVGADRMEEKHSVRFSEIIELLKKGKSLVTLLGIALYGAGYGMFLTTIPSYLILVKHYHSTAMGIFFTLFYIAISVAQIITGVLSDRMGRKVFMLAGLVVASFGIGIFSKLSQPWIDIALTIGGLGLGVYYLSSMAFLNEVVPNSLKGTISGAYYLFWGIGFFFGPMIMGWIGEGGFSLEYQFFAALLLLEAVMLSFCRGEKNQRALHLAPQRGDEGRSLCKELTKDEDLQNDRFVSPFGRKEE